MKIIHSSFIIVIGIIIVITIFFYKYNHQSNVKVKSDVSAPPGYFSETGDYMYITPLKHDIFKELTMNIVIFFILFLMIEVIGGMESFFDWDDFIDFNTFTNFRLSIFGQGFFSMLGYFIYYHIVEPQIINRIIKF